MKVCGHGFSKSYFFQILCKYCGSQGIHVKCGDLPLIDTVKWKCSFCTDVVQKLPPKTKHHLKKIKKAKKGKSSERNLNSKILSQVSFTLKATTSDVKGEYKKNYTISNRNCLLFLLFILRL